MVRLREISGLDRAAGRTENGVIRVMSAGVISIRPPVYRRRCRRLRRLRSQYIVSFDRFSVGITAVGMPPTNRRRVGTVLETKPASARPYWRRRTHRGLWILRITMRRPRRYAASERHTHRHTVGRYAARCARRSEVKRVESLCVRFVDRPRIYFAIDCHMLAAGIDRGFQGSVCFRSQQRG